VGTYTGEILLFNLIGDGTRLVDTLRTHTNAIKGLAAADGVLFSVCANTEIAWHALADGRELQRIPFAHTRIANACCALGDGAFASVGRDRMLRLWLPRGETAVRTPHPNSVKCIAASPCGRWIASGSYGGTVAIFDRQSMRFAPMQRISKAGIAALCWSAARARFVAATYNGEVHHLAIVDQINLRAAA
jgi:WD40 repeat protein